MPVIQRIGLIVLAVLALLVWGGIAAAKQERKSHRHGKQRHGAH